MARLAALLQRPRDEWDRTVELINSLPLVQKMVLQLWFVEGVRNYGTIGDMVGLTAAQAEAVYWMALRRATPALVPTH